MPENGANAIRSIYELELVVLNKGNKLSEKEARKLHDKLILQYKDFVTNDYQFFVDNEPDYESKTVSFMFSTADFVQKKTLRLQKMLRQFFSPIESTTSTGSKVINDASNETELLDSLFKKQKHLIEQIELIESKNDLGLADAEILLNHVSQLHESFTKNQAKIETYVSGATLDSQLQISGEILQKVISLQTKLKEIFTLCVLPPSKESKSDESNLTKESDEVVYLNGLLEKQKSLMEDIASIIPPSGMNGVYPKPTAELHLADAESKLTLLSELKEYFLSNQTKIETLVSDYGLCKQKHISRTTNAMLSSKEAQFKKFIAKFAAAIGSSS